MFAMFRSRSVMSCLAMLGAVVLLAGCNPGPEGVETHDPYEKVNREVHGLNRAVDKALLRPNAQAYGTVIPAPVRRRVGNFADNLGQPRRVVNDLLQLRVGSAVENGYRFVINTTIGIGGLFDPAGALGLTGRDTDFGETLYVWGVPEGAYVELPVLGPSTERRTAGRVADFFLDPLNNSLPVRERNRLLAARAAAFLGTRFEASGLIDSTLYESADSYAQARMLYLQNRRYQLGDTSRTTVIDPYEELYGR